MRSKFKFVIGDIQGCYKEFKALLKLIDPKKENKVFCVGDLVNRGPDSEKVVDFILENNIKSVLGNHDLHMLAILIGAKKHNKKTQNAKNASNHKRFENAAFFSTKFGIFSLIFCVGNFSPITPVEANSISFGLITLVVPSCFCASLKVKFFASVFEILSKPSKP